MKFKTIVASVVAAGVAAGCGSAAPNANGSRVQTKNLSAVELVAGSADATNAKKSARMNAVVEMSGSSLNVLDLWSTKPGEEPSKSLTFSMEGRISMDGKVGEVSTDMASFLPAASGSVITLRMLDGVVYIDFKALIDANAGDRGEDIPVSMADLRWVKIDLGGAVIGPGSGSPSSYTQYLEYVRGASKDGVKAVGKETIDGVVTTHFTAVIDIAAARKQIEDRLDDLDAAQAKLLTDGLKAVSQMDSLPMEVWIDDDGLLRRMKMKLDMSLEGESVSMGMVLNFSDFGVDVSDIKAPPANEVTSMEDLQSGLLG